MRRVAGALAIAAVLASGAGVSACGSGSAASANTITLYNGQHVQTADALIAAFEKKTGTNVLVRSDDEDVLADQISAEGKNSPADVFRWRACRTRGCCRRSTPARWPARRASSTRRKASGLAYRRGSASSSTTRA